MLSRTNIMLQINNDYSGWILNFLVKYIIYEEFDLFVSFRQHKIITFANFMQMFSLYSLQNFIFWRTFFLHFLGICITLVLLPHLTTPYTGVYGHYHDLSGSRHGRICDAQERPTASWDYMYNCNTSGISPVSDCHSVPDPPPYFIIWR